MGTVVLIDGMALRDFVNDEAAFTKQVDPIFKQLDVNSDGTLSRAELRPALESLNLLDSHFGVADKKTPDELQKIYDDVFDRFDTDRDEKVDKKEFLNQAKEMLLAIADGIGNSPFYMALNEGSILAAAAAHQKA